MKLSDLKVGDKFRWLGERNVYELLCARRTERGRAEWSYWNDKTGFHVATVAIEVELVTEPPEPKYRPFANAEEFKPHRDRWIKWKSGASGMVLRVTAYARDGLWHDASDSVVHWNRALEEFVFDDGTPCGELVSE